MKIPALLLLGSLPLIAQPTRIQIGGVSNTQAVLSYDSPDNNACIVQISESSAFNPLVNDVNPALYPGSNSDSRAGALTNGRHRIFVAGARTMRIASDGHYYSRALEANTMHYYAITCTGGNATGQFSTENLPLGNTYGEPYWGDPANPGATPYPWLDPSNRSAHYIDPQTGLRHVRVTFPSDGYLGGGPSADGTNGNFTGQTFNLVQDVSANWTSPNNAYGNSSFATSNGGTGGLWIGIQNTQASGTYDGPYRGVSFNNDAGSGTTGSLNFWQATFNIKGSASGTVGVCWSRNRGSSCFAPSQSFSVTTTAQSLCAYGFPGTTPPSSCTTANPDGANGGSGADPVIVGAGVNRWEAYTHMGRVSGNGTSTVTFVSGAGFDLNWISPSTILVGSVSASAACSSGTVHTVTAVQGITSTLTISDTLSSGTYYYCANNFGLLITPPASNTISVKNVQFNISYSPGPTEFTGGSADYTFQSRVKIDAATGAVCSGAGSGFGCGYYMELPQNAVGLTGALYFLNTTTGVSTYIGLMQPNPNSDSTNGWNYQINSIHCNISTPAPFDDPGTIANGHLTWYCLGYDNNLYSIVLKGEYSGPPVYQGEPVISGVTVLCSGTSTTGGSVNQKITVYNATLGTTCVWTNLTPRSSNLTLGQQFNGLPGSSQFLPGIFLGSGSPTYALRSNAELNVQNGYPVVTLFADNASGVLSFLARINPSTGVIDNYTNTWSQPNCRWCPNHESLGYNSGANLFAVSADNNGTQSAGQHNLLGPWIWTTNTAIESAPSATCPANSVGAPATGTACSVVTINASPYSGEGHPNDPYEYTTMLGPQETTHWLQGAIPGDWIGIAVGNFSPGYGYGVNNEIAILVAQSGTTVTLWRPGTLHNAAGNIGIPGSGSKNLFMLCSGYANSFTDSNGAVNGTLAGEPFWDTTTTGTSAIWTVDQGFYGGHADWQLSNTVNGKTQNSTAQGIQEKVFCGIPGADAFWSCYAMKSVVAYPSFFSISNGFITTLGQFAGQPTGAGLLDQSNASAHNSNSGLIDSFTDTHSWQGAPNLHCQWGDGTTQGNALSGTTHIYKAMNCSTGLGAALARKFIRTVATAGEHILADISGPSSSISDSTDMSYCVALVAGECFSGSSAGDVFVSASGRAYFYTYGTAIAGNGFTADNNIAEDIAMWPGGIYATGHPQVSLTPNLADSLGARLVTYANAPPSMQHNLENARVLDDSSYLILNERYANQLFRTETMAVKLPPMPPVDDVIRNTFVPVQVEVRGIAGADGMVADFGYAEYGSDGVAKFYCTSRAENCVANQASVGSTPFYYASEALSPLACANFMTCKLTIPALPGHTVYYRIRRTLSGATVGAEAPGVTVVN